MMAERAVVSDRVALAALLLVIGMPILVVAGGIVWGFALSLAAAGAVLVVLAVVALTR